jgi:hypothetical protein
MDAGLVRFGVCGERRTHSVFCDVVRPQLPDTAAGTDELRGYR